jgi:LytS/YehU family sensor histidine kinase
VEFSYALFTYMAESLFTYAVVAGIAHALAYARVLREREVAREQLQTQLARAQLQALKAQLHPHFLFNTLQAISTLVHLDPGRAERVIGSLSELLRGALAHHDAQEVTLREELAALHPYLEIERTRLGARLAVELEIDPEALDARVPHLLLQPLAENAVRHGIAPLRGGGRLEITARRSNQTLRLSISDDGAGIAGPPREGAVGLANTRARLERLYGSAHTFLIHSAPSRGTRVELELPFTCRATL